MRVLLCSIIGFVLTTTVRSQDGHYWTQQYGTRSILLSGSVIGGVEDLGAVYYNPGRLAVISNAAFLLSASVYEYNSLEVSNAFGNSKNASTAGVKGVPTLAAGTFRIKKWPKQFFAYAILTRQNADLNLSYKNEIYGDVLPALAGDEYFGAEISFNQASREQWVGLTWSTALSKKFSVGVTTNLSTNSQSKSANINMHALSANNEVAVYQFNRGFTFNQTGLLWKAGLAGNFGKWQTGLTVTTPTVNLSGSGSYQYEFFFSSAPGMTAPEYYASSYQDGLATKSRDPWSVGFGLTRLLGRNRLHISTEWFSGISKYTAMEAAGHLSQSTPSTAIGFNLVGEAKSVWNAGIGGELFLSEHVSGFASFSTDFSAVPEGITRFIERQDEASSNGWNVNFYHYGGGIVLNLKRADITIGATHTGAKQTVPRPVNFPDSGGEGIFNESDTADIKWDRWRFVFSFSFPFLDDVADKLKGQGK